MRLTARLLALSFLCILLRVLTIEVGPTVAHPQQLGGCHSYLANEAQCASGCSWVPGNPYENGAGTQQLQFFQVTCDEAQEEIPACQSSIARNVPNVTCCDQDNDGWSNPLCGGTDCRDNIASINPGVTENTFLKCSDGLDNDCDNSEDCDDSSCWSTAACQCPPISCGEGEVPGPYPSCGCEPISPIVVDVAGNGLNLTNASGGVAFDFNADGTPDRLSWTASGSDDAWLVLDRNGNGTIDSGLELFGNLTSQPQPPAGEEKHGFLALAEYDKPVNGGDGDGKIKESDAIFASLRLWQDQNHNGFSETSELHTFQELGLKSVNLDFKQSRRTDDHGNRFRYRAEVKDSADAQLGRWAWDVFLVTQP